MVIDASLIEADASKQNAAPKEDRDASVIDPADAPRAVRAYLDTLDGAAFGAASEGQLLQLIRNVTCFAKQKCHP